MPSILIFLHSDTFLRQYYFYFEFVNINDLANILACILCFSAASSGKDTDLDFEILIPELKIRLIVYFKFYVRTKDWGFMYIINILLLFLK